MYIITVLHVHHNRGDTMQNNCIQHKVFPLYLEKKRKLPYMRYYTEYIYMRYISLMDLLYVDDLMLSR